MSRQEQHNGWVVLMRYKDDDEGELHPRFGRYPIVYRTREEARKVSREIRDAMTEEQKKYVWQHPTVLPVYVFYNTPDVCGW